MADLQLYKGGIAKPNYMWHDPDYPQNGPPFAPHGWGNRLEETPPFNAQFDGVYNLKDYAAGYPLIPRRFEWQRNALRGANLAVGDILRLLVIPANHYVDFLRFDVHRPDQGDPTATPPYPGMTGATVALTAQSVLFNPATREFDYAELPDVTAALAAQGLPASIPLDVPSTTFVSLLKVDAGYVRPLYVEPVLRTETLGSATVRIWDEGGAVILGLKITALPADVKLDQALNDFYLSARVRGLDCPAGL